MEHSVPEGLEQEVQLHNHSIEEESVGQCTPGVALDEGHQEPESNKHHHVDILVHGVIVLVEFFVIVGLHFHEDAIENAYGHLHHTEEDSKPDPLLLVIGVGHCRKWNCL